VPIWAAVAAGALASSLAGLSLFAIREPVVRLTAVHYLYAGVGALTIAHRLAAIRPPRSVLATSAVVLTAGAPPVVALGFIVVHPLFQVGGAVLMTLGVWATSLMLLGTARRAGSWPHRVPALFAGLAAWGPMVLAVAWATAQHVPGVPALSIADMARTHGLVNGLGFVLAGLVATRSHPPAATTTSEHDADRDADPERADPCPPHDATSRRPRTTTTSPR
jgi:hypothetical protein